MTFRKINEGMADYKAMMRKTFEMISNDAALTREIKEKFQTIVRTAKKESRIIPILNELRIYALRQCDDCETKAMLDYATKYAKKLGVERPVLIFDSIQLFTDRYNDLIYYLSFLDEKGDNYNPALDSIEWGGRLVGQVLDDMIESSSDFSPDSNVWIYMSPDDLREVETLIDFGDGYKWIDLKRNQCPKEGNAMGHCGNEWGRYYDTILSLRRVKKAPDGGEYHKPALTFILNDLGYLWEMRGRSNQKPKEKYHKYIVPLLKLDRIKGIGEFVIDRENMFDLDDLPTEVRDELFAQKPELDNPFKGLSKTGFTRTMVDALRSDGIDVAFFDDCCIWLDSGLNINNKDDLNAVTYFDDIFYALDLHILANTDNASAKDFYFAANYVFEFKRTNPYLFAAYHKDYRFLNLPDTTKTNDEIRSIFSEHWGEIRRKLVQCMKREFSNMDRVRRVINSYLDHSTIESDGEIYMKVTAEEILDEVGKWGVNIPDEIKESRNGMEERMVSELREVSGYKLQEIKDFFREVDERIGKEMDDFIMQIWNSETMNESADWKSRFVRALEARSGFLTRY